MSQHVRVAAAHVAPCFMDARASAEKAITWLEEAATKGVDLVVFPEVFIPGFPYWINLYPPLLQAGVTQRYQAISVAADGPELALVCNAAARLGVAVVMGFSERPQEHYTCYNSAAIIARDGSLLGVHRKLKPTYAERYVWGEGDGSTLLVVSSTVGRVGALICWEHVMNLARQALVEDGEQIHAALWPALSTMAGFDTVANSQIEAMMRNHALTAQTFVVCASSPVTQEIVDFLGRELGPQNLMGLGGGWSAVVHPFTPLLAGPICGAEEQLVIADIDLDAIAEVKLWVDAAGHYARPDVLRLSLDRSARSGVLKP